MLLLSPGQGSQGPGLLVPWLTQPGAHEQVALWSVAADLDLVELGSNAPAEALRPTQVAQPLLTAAALLSARALLAGRSLDGNDIVCGHSIGELSALALAGVLDDDVAVSLAAARGRLMAAAAAVRPTGLTALLGAQLEPGAGQTDAWRAAGLELATVNAPGQIVLGGGLDDLASWAPPEGVRIRRLEVAGAFHTSAMQPAVNGFTSLIADLSPREPTCRVVANADGCVVASGRELLDRLVRQLVAPVRFDLCLETLARMGAQPAFELAPAGVLSALCRRAAPTLAVAALRSPADLPMQVSP